jgi:hypothetical protein
MFRDFNQLLVSMLILIAIGIGILWYLNSLEGESSWEKVIGIIDGTSQN